MVLRVLVDDGAVLQVPQVEHSDRSICSHRRKHVSSTSRTAECNVIHLRARAHTHTNKQTVDWTVLLNCAQNHTPHSSTDLFVVSNQLSLHMSRHQVDSSQYLTRLQPPDGAGGVDAGGACEGGSKGSAGQTATSMYLLTVQFLCMFTQKIGIDFIPVKRGERGTEIRILVVI